MEDVPHKFTKLSLVMQTKCGNFFRFNYSDINNKDELTEQLKIGQCQTNITEKILNNKFIKMDDDSHKHNLTHQSTEFTQFVSINRLLTN